MKLSLPIRSPAEVAPPHLDPVGIGLADAADRDVALVIGFQQASMATLRNRTPDRQGRLGGLPRGKERRADRLPSSARTPPDLEAMADDVGRGGKGRRRHGNSPQAAVPHER